MTIVKIKRDLHGGVDYLKNACEYIFNGKALAYGGYMVNDRNANKAFNQMMIVKKFYYKTNRNPLVHIIVSYDKDDDKTVEDYVSYSKMIAGYFRRDYQVLWCLHKKETAKSLYHTHIVVNSVNINNGKLIHTSIGYVCDFCKYIRGIIKCSTDYYFEKTNNDDINKKLEEYNFE